MRRALASIAITLLFTTGAFAHGGKSHRLMGTVAQVDQNQLTITTTANEDAEVALTDATKYEKDGKASDRSALALGARVSIELSEDDKTALKVKIGGGGHHQH